MKNILKITFVILLISLTSCADKSTSSSGLRGYDPAVLKNWAENIIIPAYKNYQSKAADLVAKAEAFKANPTTAELENFKNSWLESYKAFQKTMIFDIRVSSTYNYVMKSNTYPSFIDPSESAENNIKSNIEYVRNDQRDKINLGSSVVEARFRFQGFPALDYLLYSNQVDIMNDEAAREYMAMLAQTLKSDIDRVVNDWDTNKEKYIKDDNQSVSGAYSSTINAFIRVYEKQIRADKVGYAAGAIKAQEGKVEPDMIEAYYKKDISKELLKIALQSSQDFFNGKHFDGNGEGKSLRQILEGLGEKALAKSINDQYTKMYAEIDGISGNLRDLAANDTPKMKKLYDVIQVNVSNYKTKMLAALNVQVGYQDTDGD